MAHVDEESQHHRRLTGDDTGCIMASPSVEVLLHGCEDWRFVRNYSEFETNVTKQLVFGRLQVFAAVLLCLRVMMNCAMTANDVTQMWQIETMSPTQQFEYSVVILDASIVWLCTAAGIVLTLRLRMLSPERIGWHLNAIGSALKVAASCSPFIFLPKAHSFKDIIGMVQSRTRKVLGNAVIGRFAEIVIVTCSASLILVTCMYLAVAMFLLRIRQVSGYVTMNIAAWSVQDWIDFLGFLNIMLSHETHTPSFLRLLTDDGRLSAVALHGVLDIVYLSQSGRAMLKAWIMALSIDFQHVDKCVFTSTLTIPTNP